MKVSHITVVRGVIDDVFLHLEGVKAPVWPFNEGFALQFQSARERTVPFLQEHWPGAKVEIVASGEGFK